MNPQSSLTAEQARERLLTLFIEREALYLREEQLDSEIKALRNYAGGFASGVATARVEMSPKAYPQPKESPLPQE